ncbi:hypothetical protein ATE49_16160 [Elizabethkingia miricola]|uniref:Fibrobacter succinogenes major domain (Fib_succ_major) n=1 Tax=Elizabethkingia miricola TaxID=172045 RepID=A0ABY3NHE9_ELIMR|nr:hypothetical protein [Elizabethkingia miricola]OBS11319.1 hypothetical protein ATE49_16160 [Elizabethkingia miricola]TYO92484.1 hypothetical protein LX74_01444 [Elizabethkingia miricola]
MQNKNKLICALLLIGGCIGSISSCSSREDGGTTESDGKTVLNISPNIIEDEIITLANTKTKSGSSVLQNSVITKEQMSYGNDFDALVEITASSGKLSNATASLDNKAIAAANPRMGNGISYVVRIFQDNAGSRGAQIGSDYTFTVGGAPPKITVDGGTKYQWYAFSSNEATVPATMIAAGKSVIDAPVSSNKDILYASGTISTVSGNNYLDINFKHMTTRIDVNIDSKGMFVPMSGNSDATANIGTYNGTTFTGIITQQTFDLGTGSFYGGAAPIQSDKALDSQVYSSKVVSFYSSSGVFIPSGNTLKVKLTNMEFKQLNNVLHKFNRVSYVTLPQSSSKLLGTNFKYNVNVRLIQSAVNVGGVLWARNDISYEGSNSYNVPNTRINGFDGFQPIGNLSPTVYYWSWNALRPTDAPNSGNYDTTQDPCVQLYPVGTWRMPTSVEATALTTKIPDNTRAGFSIYSNNANFGVTFNHTAGANTPEYGSARSELYIQYNGYRPVNYTPNENSPYPNSITGWTYNAKSTPISSYPDTVGMFWTKDPGAAAGTAKAFVWRASFSNNGTENTASFPAGNIQDIDKRTGLNIRCVRSVAAPNT